MVAGICGWTKPLGKQLGGTALTAEGQHGEIEFSGAAGIRDGVFLEETNALTEGPVADFAIDDAEAARETHDDEIRLHRVVIEIEEQLQEAGGGTEEGHFAVPEVGLERVEALPELVEVGRIANPAGNLKTFEVAGERTAVADDAVEHTGTLNDAGNLAAKAKVAKPGPVGGEDALRVATSKCCGVETSESFVESGRFDQLANERRARPLTVGDGDTDAAHYFAVVRERLKCATRPARNLISPSGSCGGSAMSYDDRKGGRGANFINFG